MTKACAEAMGYETQHVPAWDCSPVVRIRSDDYSGTADDGWFGYDPLRDDAQAMALVKRFKSCMNIHYETVDYGRVIKPPYWEVRNYYPELPPNYGGTARNADLNRAIVECVAKLKTTQ